LTQQKYPGRPSAGSLAWLNFRSTRALHILAASELIIQPHTLYPLWF
jgi:hypothetical protein